MSKWAAYLFSIYIISTSLAFAEDVSLTDKEIIERLVRLEEGQVSLNKRLDDLIVSINSRFDDVNKRFDDVNKRIDGLEKRMDGLEKRIDNLHNEMINFMLWGFGVMFAGMFSLVGFIIWDRRSTIAPVIKSVKEIEATVEELKRREKLVKTP